RVVPDESAGLQRFTPDGAGRNRVRGRVKVFGRLLGGTGRGQPCGFVSAAGGPDNVVPQAVPSWVSGAAGAAWSGYTSLMRFSFDHASRRGSRSRCLGR